MNINESITVKEHYFDENGGLFIKPSPDVPLRPDVTGYVVGSANSEGQLGFITNKLPFTPSRGPEVEVTLGETTVTSNSQSARIKINLNNVLSGASFTLTVNNSLVFTSSIVIVQVVLGLFLESDDRMVARVTDVSDGSFEVTLDNITADTYEEAYILLNYFTT